MEIVEVLGVAGRRQSARRYHLALKAVGLDLGFEVVGDIQRYHLDALLCPGDGFAVGKSLLDLLLLRFRFLAEERVEQLVQRARALDSQIRQPGLIEDLHRRAVLHRLADSVGVDQRAEAPHGAAAKTLVDGRSGEPDQHRVGQRLGQPGAQLPVLGPVGLVHHDDDVVGGVEGVQFGLGCRQDLLEFRMMVITVRPVLEVSRRRRSMPLSACSGAGNPHRSKVREI